MNVPKQKSPLRTVLIVLAAIVGFLVLIAAAGVAWVMFRPVNSGDFSSATSDWEAAVQPLDEIETLHSQVTDLTKAPDPAQQQMAVDQQHEKLDALDTSLDEFGSERALKDEGYRAAYDTVVGSYDEKLKPMATDYVDNYPKMVVLEQACLAYDKVSGTTTITKEMGVAWFDEQIADCEKAVTDAAGSTSWGPYVQARKASIDDTRAAFTAAEKALKSNDELGYQKAVLQAYQHNNDARRKQSEGLQATADQNNAVFTEFRAQVDAVTAYGTERS